MSQATIDPTFYRNAAELVVAESLVGGVAELAVVAGRRGWPSWVHSVNSTSQTSSGAQNRRGGGGPLAAKGEAACSRGP